MGICGTLTRDISRKLNISCKCIRQTIRKFDQFNTVTTKPGAGRPPKVINRQKRAIKLQQLRDDTFSLRFKRWYPYQSTILNNCHSLTNQQEPPHPQHMQVSQFLLSISIYQSNTCHTMQSSNSPYTRS
jgi:hypothetical protein